MMTIMMMISDDEFFTRLAKIDREDKATLNFQK